MVGLRPTVRWQRYVKDWLAQAHDAEIVELVPSPDGKTGSVTVRFSGRTALDEKYLRIGEGVELLDAFKVIAVGKISAVSDV
jgi:hypothetical protein